VLAIAYTLMFYRCYVSFLFGEFEYVGYDLFRREPVFLAESVAIAVMPVLCYRGMRATSSAIAVLIYLVLYVPIIVTFTLGSSKGVDEIRLVQLTFMVSMSVIFLADTLIVRNPLRLDIGVDLMPLIWLLTALSTVYLLFVYRGKMSFASFGDDLYLQRDANAALGAGLLTAYLSAWLSTVLVPLCLAHGLTARKHRFTINGMVACLVLYMAAANKLAILIPFVYVAFFLLFRRHLTAILPVMTAVFVVIVAGMLSIAGLGQTALVTAAIILNRTLGNGGQLTVAYYDYFAFYARTGYSHVHGLGLLTQPYPYGDLILGQVVGQFYWSPFMNANANFWATDGLAAVGLPGVAIISVALALLLVVMNSVTRGYDQLFAVLCFLPFVSTLLNQSLFSGIWSGGAFILLLFFAFNRRAQDPPTSPRVATAGGIMFD
jgi:hypothetical protein